MPGDGRRTHDFPQGKPFLLTLVEIAGFVSFFASAIAFGFNDWRSVAPTAAILIAYAATYSLMFNRYERTGRAIPRKRTNVVVKFPSGFPRPLLAARLAFFVVAGVMLVFGLAPFRFEVANAGTICCVFGLIGVAVLNLLLEWHYVKAGRAVEVEFTTTNDK